MKILDSNIQDYVGTNFSVYRREEGVAIIEYKKHRWLYQKNGKKRTSSKKTNRGCPKRH